MEIELRSKKPPPIERRIVLLKDFLRDDISSCSSSGFKSFPRRTCCTSIRSLLESDLKSRGLNNSKKLLKSQSKAAATTSTTISAFQKASVAVINVVKNFTFSSSKSSKQGIFPSLPRSFSRRLRRSFWKKNDKVEREIKVAVRVKDIMRWKSFRDLVEDKPKSLDCPVSPIQTTTTSISWSDSDFTTESLHSSSGSSESSGETEEVDSCKKNLTEENKKWKSKRDVDHGDDDDDDEEEVVEEDSNSNSTEKNECQSEKDQFSPVSVLDFPPSEEDEESSSFQSCLNNMEKTKQKVMQKIRRFENIAQLEPVNLDKRIESFELIIKDDSLELPCRVDTSSNSISEDQEEEVDDNDEQEFINAEEKARKLLELIREFCNSTEDLLLLDFFRDEIIERSTKRVAAKENELDQELLNFARDWINGKCGVLLDWGFEESRKVYLTEIEKGGNWRVTAEEHKEVGLEMEIIILDSLMNEVILDLSS